MAKGYRRKKTRDLRKDRAMNEYLVECFGCDDEMIVSTGSDIPAFCPLCGEDDVVVTKKEFVIDTDWDEDD